MEKIDLPRCIDGKFVQYQGDQPVLYFEIRGKTLNNIQLLTNISPKYVILPPICKTRNFVCNILLEEYALSGLDKPKLVYTGKGNMKIKFPAKEDEIELILPKDKKLYIVKERVDVGYEYDTTYYYLISDKNFEGYHEMGKRELSVKEIKNYDLMGRKLFTSAYTYDRKLNAILACNEQVKY